MYLLADTPSLGLWIGGPIAIISIFIGVCIVGYNTIKIRNPRYTPSDNWIGMAIGTATIIITLGICAFAYYPYKHDFHFWVPKEGTVTQKGQRLIRDGESVSQRIVLVLDGQPYGVDDTRATLVKVGDRVRLRCKREFDFGSTNHGWACKWVGFTPGGQR